MDLMTVYREARQEEYVARVRRVLALRALTATGSSQRQIAEALRDDIGAPGQLSSRRWRAPSPCPDVLA